MQLYKIRWPQIRGDVHQVMGINYNCGIQIEILNLTITSPCMQMLIIILPLITLQGLVSILLKRAREALEINNKELASQVHKDMMQAQSTFQIGEDGKIKFPPNFLKVSVALNTLVNTI